MRDVDANEVVRQLPEIAQIEDATTRDRVVAVWCRSWGQSNWAKLEDACFDPGIPGVSLVSHVRVDAQSCLALARIYQDVQGIVLDSQTLLVLALIHDVSKLVEYEEVDGSWRKSEVGRRMQHGVLGAHFAMEEGFGLEMVHLILTHTPQSKMPPDTVEGVLHEHADLANADVLHFLHLGTRVPPR